MKKVLFLFAVVLTALQLSAADVTLQQAQAAASAFLTKQVKAGSLNASAASNLQLVKAEASVAKPTAVDYYIFNSAKSYVVVAGDDQAPQILMYGEDGALDMNNIPPAMQWLLNKYKFQIDGLKAGTRVAISIPKTATAVAPLVKANWDQSAPYNNQCPTSGSSHAVTGCPATSLAMCFYKWKWPETLPALSKLTSTQGGLSASALSERDADWDNIIDEYTGPTNTSYTTAQANAVAWLMRYVGQAIPDYYYSTSASGANDPEILEGCHNMGYTDAQLLTLTELVSSGGWWGGYTNSEQYYTDAQWNEWMLNELYNGRPIEYLAYDCSSYQPAGHAFNVFGVDSNGKYYVNWGWSGQSNGYCTLHNFTTAVGSTGQSGSYVFNYGEAMIIGIEPPGGSTTTPVLAVNPTSLSFTGTTGQTYTKTFTVSGTDLRSTVNITSNSAYFTVSPSTLTKEQAEAGATITVTYKPTSSGTQNATITVSSTGAESKTVSVSGTATTVPTLVADPSTINLSSTVGTPVSQTFNLSGTNLSNTVYLSCEGAEFSIDKTVLTQTAVSIGTTVKVTYSPTAAGTHTGTITITSSGAQSATVILNGQADIVKLTPVMLPADEQYINLTKFRADWTDETPDENVESYTLEVTPTPTAPAVELIGSLIGTDFTGSSTGYYDIVLPAPWSGNNVRGGLNRIIYFRQRGYQNATQEGKITFTIPEGYDDMPFTLKITTDNTTDGTGNFTVATPQTAAVGHNFSAGETYSWLVTAKSGEMITITSTKSQYSPDIVKIEVYTGDATAANLMLLAQETGDENSRLITGITDKFYTVENLLAEGTFLYRVKTLYLDGTWSDWSNVEEVTLFENGHGYEVGDVNHDGKVNIGDVTALINALLSEEPSCPICSDVNQDGKVNIGDVTALINRLLEGTPETNASLMMGR